MAAVTVALEVAGMNNLTRIDGAHPQGWASETSLHSGHAYLYLFGHIAEWLYEYEADQPV